MINQLYKLQKTYDLMRPSGASKSVICDFAENMANTINFKPGDDIYEVIHRNGGKIHYSHTIQCEHCAIIYVHEPNNFDIIMSGLTGPLNSRFSIANRLGRYLMHKPHTKSWSNQQNRRLNIEACWFAMEFLMPQKTFTKMKSSICEMAAYFQVPIDVAKAWQKQHDM